MSLFKRSKDEEVTELIIKIEKARLKFHEENPHLLEGTAIRSRWPINDRVPR